MSNELIAITGGSGFVGSHVVDALLGAGYDVRVIDPRPPMQPDAEWADVDMLDQDSVTDALKNAHAVFHLAAMADVNDIVADPAGSVALNTLGVARVLEAGRRADAGRVIVSSTVWVYAATHGDVVDETTLFDLETDRHLYVSEKIAAEMFCRDYATLFGRPYTVLRYGIPFGPRMRSDLVVAAFLLRAIRGEPLRIDGDGSQERRFVYVEDLAAAHVLALKPAAKNRTYNLESSEATSIRELAETVRDLVGDVEVTFGPTRPGDYRARIVQSEPARDELGWEPRHTFAEGLRKTLAWYREQQAGSWNAPTPRRIAVVPAYNEEPMVAIVLEELYPLVDELVVVDDGSTDNTRAEIEQWMARGRPKCRLLIHEVNRGMSEAYHTALTELRERLSRNELSADDLVFTVDADGQHDLHVLDELVEMTHAEGLDANIARRDLSYHGPFKRTGNWVLSKWASGWAGAPLHDVESGYRIFRLGALAHALDYYSGYQYSETVEVAVVLCQLGYKVRNDHVVPVPVARSRTRFRDAAIDLAVIPVAAGRVWRRDRVREAFRTDAIAHLAIAAVLGVLIALTYQHSTDTVFTLVLASLAAFGLGALLRRSVPRPSLALLGAVLALLAAWLIPQRTDAASAIVLSGVFGVGAALAAPVVRRPRPAVIGPAFAALVVIALAGSRDIVLGFAVAAVFVAALVSRFGRIGIARQHRLRTLALGSALVVAASGLTGYLGASTVGATWFGGGVVHGPRTSNEVAITFDDGPDVTATPKIVKILDSQHVKGSFFVVGKTLDTSPQVVRDLVADGQLVGNHSYHHDDWRWLDPTYPELERTQEAFAREIGTCPVWFRPPNGQRTPMMARVVKDHRMRMAMWDVGVSDRGTNDPKAIASKVLSSAKGGSIIALHAGLDGTSPAHRTAVVAALPLIIDGLRARGLRPVRLDKLVGGPAYQSCDKSRS